MERLDQRKQQATMSIGRAVLSRTKPEEVILLDGLVSDQTAKSKDEMLGFGGAAELLLVSPVLIGFLKDAGKGVLEVLGENAGETLAKALTKESSPSFDSTKLRALRVGFAQRLEGAGFGADDVAVISDCLVSVLLEYPEWLRSLVS